MNIGKSLLQVPILLVTVCAASGQMPARMVPTPVAASAPTVVPALVPYSGVVLGGDGKALSGEIGFTFLLFKEEQGGDPLWMESQTVLLDSTGHYLVQLGAGSPSGLPPTTFASGEGRWLEVQIAGQPPQSRVLLMSVPYAMKAADAATLGGLPASAYALAGPSSKAAATAGVVPDAALTVTTTGGTAGYMPEFSGAATIVDSPVFILGADVGIGTITPTATLDVNGTALISGALTANGGATVGGSLVLPATGTATASGGFDSQLLKMYTSAYNSSTKAAVDPRFEWEAVETGNDTGSPTATLQLLASNGPAGVAATGFSFNTNGTLNFAPGQTFPGGTGTGTITGVTAGTDLTGGGTSGNVTLNLNTSKIITGITAGSGLTGGGTVGVVTLTVDTTKIPTLTDSPTFTGTITANSKTSGKPAIAANGTSGGYGISAISDTGYAGVFGSDGTTNSTLYSANSASSSGTAIQAYAQGTDGTGIHSYAEGAGGYGLYAIATGAADPQDNAPVGVFGQADAGVGVSGTSANNTGVFGTSTNGYGVLGTSTSGTAVFAETTTGYGVYSLGSTGSAGYFESSPPENATLYVYNDAGTDDSGSYPQGIFASVSGVQGIGVSAFTAEGTGVFGVSVGQSNTWSQLYQEGIAGVWGDGTSDFVLAGIVGTADDNSAGFFEDNADDVPTIVVMNDGTGGTGDAVPALFRTLRASTSDGTCGFGGKGDLTCTGQVKTLATTTAARTVETYAMQSTENWMEDFGSAALKNGAITVSIDPAFAETVNTAADYHVFLTPNGDSKGLYVVAKTATSFEVREAGAGTSSLAFDYRIVAKRRGYEAERLVDVTERFQAETARSSRRLQAAAAQGFHRPQVQPNMKPPVRPIRPALRAPRPPQTPSFAPAQSGAKPAPAKVATLN